MSLEHPQTEYKMIIMEILVDNVLLALTQYSSRNPQQSYDFNL